MKKILFVIDPGHTTVKYNAGAVSGYYESNAMLALSRYEKAYLEHYGFDVILTHEMPNYDIDLYDRGYMAISKASGYDFSIFESNHTNAAASASACGATIIRSAHLPKSEDLANKILEGIVSLMRPETQVTYNREPYTRQNTSNTADWYGVIRGAVGNAKTQAQAEAKPCRYAFITEHAFHTNVNECRWLYNDANLKRLAETKAKIYANYFGMTANGKPVDVPDPYDPETKGYLVKGDTGNAVMTAQKNLNRILKYTGVISPLLEEDGSFGPLTRAAVIKLQQHLDLEVDGSYGPITKATVERLAGVSAYDNNDIIEKLLHTMAQDLGYTNGDKMWKAYGYKTWVSWCVIALWYWFDQLGLVDNQLILKEDDCLSIKNFYSKQGLWVEPAIGRRIPLGALVTYDWDGTDGEGDHIGFVVYENGKHLVLIEGNKSGAPGGCVGYRFITTDDSTLFGYALPNYNAASSVTPSEDPKPTLYRVRREWTDVTHWKEDGQTGAYHNLTFAKNAAKKDGLKVYDDTGNLVYDPN